MDKPIQIPKTRIITVSGRIASGSTTLAKLLAQQLDWKHIEGGEIFWEAIREKMGVEDKDTHLRPDEEDKLFDAKLKQTLNNEKNLVLETKLAGYNAQEIEGVFKILVVCENEAGEDQTQIRIDRLMNREDETAEAAKEEVLHREKSDLEKWRRLYAADDPNWVYYDKKYYDLVINTFSHSSEQTLEMALAAINK